MVNSGVVIGIGAAVLAGGMIAFGFSAHQRAMAQAENAYLQVAGHPDATLRRFDPRQVAHLPEIAQRYFRNSIAPGTPLYSVVELEMDGTFLLGDREKFRTFRMSARQVLRPPDQFVWIPEMRSGVMSISGSDVLARGEAWTRFWLNNLVPVAQERSSPDLVRSAQFRAAIEGALWLPTSLLPGNGAEWEQVSTDEARIILHRFRPEIVLQLVLNETGSVTEVTGQRWSNANAEKNFRMQAFGGTASTDRTFGGLTIPTEVAVGNHYGSTDYLPFFQARISRAAYR